MFYKLTPFVFLFLFSLSPNTLEKSGESVSVVTEIKPTISVDAEIALKYHSLNSNSFQLPNNRVFSNALMGFYKLKSKGLIEKDIITLVDFSLSSIEKRLWVIDVKNNAILYQSLVAHGRNSGGEFATKFSNKIQSLQSSLGFYATAETYFGKHGYSLRLDGLEKGVNSNARERAIVIHGADYVSEKFIAQNGRLGRSYGCPSLPKELSKEVIDLIKNKSLLYIYHKA